MTDETPARPLPHASDLTRPYWQGAAEGKLLIQRCPDCGTLRHYPRYICDHCHSFETEWVPSSGRGRVHSWMVAHHPYHPAFAAVPYTLVTVELEEGVRALGRYVEPDGAGLRLDLPVTLRMETVADGVALPLFEPAED